MPFESIGPVWPFLLLACAICARWNWRAAIMFALAVGVGRATTVFELTQVHLFFGYTLLAVVSAFFFDKIAGIILAIYTLFIFAHIAGFLGNMPKMIIGETLLITGTYCCGRNGPSGGIWGSNSGLPSNKHHSHSATFGKARMADSVADPKSIGSAG